MTKPVRPIEAYGQFALDVLERTQRILRKQPKVTVMEVVQDLPVRVKLPRSKTLVEIATEVLEADTRFDVRNNLVGRGFDFAQPNLEVRTEARNPS